MAIVKMDTTGMRCPQPVLKIAALAPDMVVGDVLEVRGDCPTFESDIRKWCGRMRRTLLAVTVDGKATVASIQF